MKKDYEAPKLRKAGTLSAVTAQNGASFSNSTEVK